MKLWNDFIAKAFAGEINRQVRAALASEDPGFHTGRASVKGNDPFFTGGRANVNERDRWDADREEVLRQALDAWRINPLARRIVGLTTQYVVGSGFSVNCKHQGTADFIRDWMRHPLNRMETRISEMCDELTRSGNLFVLISTDSSGMSYVRCVPALDIDRIEARSNDIEQALMVLPQRYDGRPCSAPLAGI
jgi:hypothetical protein